MAKHKERVRTISIETKQGAFSAFINRFKSEKKKESSEISLVRSFLTDEKARTLSMLKSKQPNSIYELAKLLGRDFKSVRQDISLFEKLGFIEMIPIHKGKRHKLKPLLVLDELRISMKI